MEKKQKVKVRTREIKMCEGSDGGKSEESYSNFAHKKPQDAMPKNQVSAVMLFGVPIVSLVMDGKERLCLAQISSTLLKEFSYNEIHNRRVALGITCIQCTPVQLEILRRAGAMPVTSRRCGMITRREAERLCQSFLGDHAPPQLPENFAFDVYHECAWGCRGNFVPSRYNSSRAKCIRCSFCQLFFSPNKFIFHSHRLPDSRYVQPDAANFNSWRRHLRLCGDPPEDVSSLSPSLKHSPATGETNSVSSIQKHSFPPKDYHTASSHCDDVLATAQIVHAWEDVKAMFNGGTRKRLLAAHSVPTSSKRSTPPSVSPSGSYAASSSGNNPSGQVPAERNSVKVSSHSQQSSINGPVPMQRSFSDGAGFPGFISPVAGSPPFLNLSPARIWNPGVTNQRENGRFPNDPNEIHALPLAIHPFSIPWLRRPPFTYGTHPFESNRKYLAETSLFPEGLPIGTTESPSASSSAFRPVPPQATGAPAEQILSTWLNSSALRGGLVQIPEDLSLHSGNSASINSVSPFYLHTASFPPRLVDTCNKLPRVVSAKNLKIPEPLLAETRSMECDSRKQEVDCSSNISDGETVDVESTDSEREADHVTSSNKDGSQELNPQSEDDLEVDIGDSTVNSSGAGHFHRYSGHNGQRQRSVRKKKRRLWNFYRTSRCNSPK